MKEIIKRASDREIITIVVMISLDAAVIIMELSVLLPSKKKVKIFFHPSQLAVFSLLYTHTLTNYSFT